MRSARKRRVEGSGSATVTASLPKQSIALTRPASVPFKKQITKLLEHNHYKLNQRAYKASFFSELYSVLKITNLTVGHRQKACQNNNLAETTLNSQLPSVDKIGQRTITKEKSLEYIQIYSL